MLREIPPSLRDGLVILAFPWAKAHGYPPMPLTRQRTDFKKPTRPSLPGPKLMRALIQRVSSASVTIDGCVHSSIGPGLLILLGVEEADGAEDIEWLSGKIARLRIFSDPAGLMNLSLTETRGEALVVSQFTLHAAMKKGNRPSFIRAARPELAVPAYEAFCAALSRELACPVQTGVFGAEMQVALVNDGPVTIWMDSKNRE